jgi:hypothetical protein
MTDLYYPAYIQIVERKLNGWFQPQKKIIFNPNNRLVDPLNLEKIYGLNKTQIITQLFRLYHGKLGYYLVHLPKREYYYCGLTKQDIQQKLWELGITRPDPMEKQK